MRKVSTLALLLSLILGTSFAFTACNVDPSGSSDSSSSSSYDPDEGKTPEQLEEEANAGYAERIAEWTKYVEYAAPEKKAAVEDSQLTKKDSDKLTSRVQVIDNLYQVTEKEDIYTTVETPEVVDPDTKETLSPATSEILKTATKTTQKVYDAETDTVVLELQSFEYVVSGGKLLDTAKKRSDHVKYVVLTDEIDDLIVVKKTMYKLNEPAQPAPGEEPEEVDDTLVANYTAEITLSVYDKKGNLLHKALPEDGLDDAEIIEVSTSDAWKTQKLISIADKTHMLLDGEIIKTFDRGTEYDVPQYNSEESQHSYFQYGDYGYYIVEAVPELMQIGDFAMARVPGLSIEAINADKQLVWNYDTTSYHVAGYSVLSDGDIYLCEYKMLESGATDFAFESAGIKFDVIHSRIDVETGAVTQLEKDFIAQKVYNNVTPEIDTLLNNAATAEVLANCKVKDGYMLAQVQKYADGVLGSDTEIAVLDEEMNIVATLPKIIGNQFGYVGFLDKDTMLVNTITTEQFSIFYTADTKTGDVELYLSMNAQTNNINFKYIEGGFVYNHKIYDYDWNVQYDLDPDDKELTYSIKGDTVYIKESIEVTTYEGTEWQTTEKIGYFTDGYYGTLEFETKTISTYKGRRWSSNVEAYSDCYVVRRNETYVNKVEIYDHLGNQITEVDTSVTYQSSGYYDDDDNYNYVTYEVEKNVTLSEVGETGTYLVCIAETWALDSYNDVPDAAHNKSGTYYQYYILK